MNMANEKVIMLIETKLQPQRRVELIEAVRQYLPLVRAEKGVETFYITARKRECSGAFQAPLQPGKDFHPWSRRAA